MRHPYDINCEITSRGVRPYNSLRSAGRHVHEPAVVTLESHRHRRSWPISVLGNNQIGLAGAGRFALVSILAMQKNNHVRVLLYTIMQADSICHKIVSS